MAQKKRLSKRKASPKKKRSGNQDGEPLQLTLALRKALAGLPKPARAVFERADEFRRLYPELYELITRDVDSPDYRRRVERRIERVQKQKRGEQR